jgi:hypothetical protein
MALRFEFDHGNKILLLRFEGRFTEESAQEVYREIRKYSTATDPSAGILDLSSVTEFAISSDFLRFMATLDPAMPDATSRPRVVVVPKTEGFGLFRMFGIMGERTNPLHRVVHTMDEALAELGVQAPHFEPME